MTTATPLRIGEVAERLGTTTRTIRYYEEIGLLGSPGATEREAGRHRTSEEARAALRTEWRSGLADEGRRREILEQALGHIDRQLELVRRRRQDIDALEGELADKRAQVRRKLRDV
jgi:DNA-binding transcriptional MerR regulator